jgi:hypothetical protein
MQTADSYAFSLLKKADLRKEQQRQLDSVMTVRDP